MAIMENNEADLMQLWAVIQELGEQLSQNRSTSVSLYGLAGNIKNQALHSQSGFVLRRFNLDKPKEEYDAELERMNSAMSAENQSLQHDNKQLNTLIKEYEQTLETLMSNFRNRAKDVQERELTLIREYETKLLAREEEIAAQDLQNTTAISSSLARLSHVLRQLLRSEGGEDAEAPTTRVDDDEDREPWTAAAAADYALEREIELARLEKENEELRRMMGLVPPQPRRGSSDPRPMFEPRPDAKRAMSLGKTISGIGPMGGAFGTFPSKRIRSPG
ncbi:hypothetical protein BDQ12DRAFT_679779 [Crucibulum laeve]|uniref:Uncharacterized protein n=1 Tax=Crucibulum laeve TaxID=68775 RepID=A0A5C3M9Z9_9AGAR|nr:hypothetical protein BDQ12DRAFT_679779 [Crucibulum laeve]